MFKKLHLANWRQFATVDLAFHPRLTVLTGANGSGKTTILHLLNRHWGWNLQYVSTPRWDRKGVRRYWAGFWSHEDAFETEEVLEMPTNPPPQQRHIGSLTYLEGTEAELWVPENVGEVFAVNINPQRSLPGIYVPSHRPPYVFQKVEQIPTQLDAKDQIFQTYLQELMNRYNAGQRTQSPSFRIKSSLISLATFGYGNEAVDRNEDAVRLFEGFENILRTCLPRTLGFRRLRVRVPDIVLDTDSGPFSFDAVSGGVAAIVDLVWQIYMYAQLHNRFVVVVDEPETHLHPALQQRLLPDLLAAFPECQFVVATHNPFMVTSVAESHVYVLRYNDETKVESSPLEAINRAAGADDILRDVLGVPYTMPQWAHQKLQAIIADHSRRPLTVESMERLKADLATIGLEAAFPSTLLRITEEQT